MKNRLIFVSLLAILFLPIFFSGYPGYAGVMGDSSETAAQWEAKKQQWLLQKNYETSRLKDKRDFLYALRSLLQSKLERAMKWETLYIEQRRQLSIERSKVVQEKKAYREQRKQFEAAIKQRKEELGMQQNILGDQAKDLALQRVLLAEGKIKLKEDRIRFIRSKENFRAWEKTQLIEASGSTVKIEEMQSRLKGLQQSLLTQEGKLLRAHESMKQALDKKEAPVEAGSKNLWQIKAVSSGTNLLMAAPVLVAGDSEMKNSPSIFRGRATASRS